MALVRRAARAAALAALAAAAAAQAPPQPQQNDGDPTPPSPTPGAGGDGGGRSAAAGFAGAAVAAACFGSNFVVVKRYDAGDGMCFQFCMCIGVFLTGLVYHIARGLPPMQLEAMLGGVLWATGNVLSPWIIGLVGLGRGFSIWCAFNLLTGWGSARLGVLGVSEQAVSRPGMNAAGALFALVSVFVYARVRPPPDADSTTELGGEEAARLVAHTEKCASAEGGGGDAACAPPGEVAEETEERGASSSAAGAAAGARRRAALGVALSLAAGVLFGSCFNPPQHLSDRAAKEHCNAARDRTACGAVSLDSGRTYCSWDGGADDGKKCGGMPVPDMAFSWFCGAFATSWAYFAAYVAAHAAVAWRRGGAPAYYVNVPLILPAMASGAVWAGGQIGFFVANANLSQAVAFPIVLALPSVVNNAWGFFVFREVARTPGNVATLLAALSCSILAAVLTSLSK